MVTGAARRQEVFRGLRPLNPSRDLNQVADLLRVAFQDELGRSEAAWLQDMESLGALKPVVWLLNQVNLLLGSLFHGFVWIENDRVVGNVTITRVSPENWMISNVAVDPDYRRRGIARELMGASVDWIHSRNARWATLEVRRDNVPAKSLYLDMGFVIVEGTTDMERHGTGLTSVLPAPEGYQLQPARPSDSSKMYELACQVTPELAQHIAPIRRRDYEVGGLEWLSKELRWLVGLPATLHWVATDPDDQVIAMLQVRTGGHSRRLRMLVHPDARGMLEEVLVSRGLEILSRHRGRTHAKVNADHMEAILALEAHGFREVRTLDRMALELAQ